MFLPRLFCRATVPVKPKRVSPHGRLDSAHHGDIGDVNCATIVSPPLDLVQVFVTCFIRVVIAMRGTKPEADKLLSDAISKVTALLAGPS